MLKNKTDNAFLFFMILLLGKKTFVMRLCSGAAGWFTNCCEVAKDTTLGGERSGLLTTRQAYIPLQI